MIPTSTLLSRGWGVSAICVGPWEGVFLRSDTSLFSCSLSLCISFVLLCSLRTKLTAALALAASAVVLAAVLSSWEDVAALDDAAAAAAAWVAASCYSSNTIQWLTVLIGSIQEKPVRVSLVLSQAFLFLSGEPTYIAEWYQLVTIHTGYSTALSARRWISSRLTCSLVRLE